MKAKAIVVLAMVVISVADGRANEASDILTIDQLLSITSAVSGSPEWSPDGESVLISSSFAGGLATLSPDGGFPVRVPIDMGGAGHFLSSQMPGWSPRGTWISYVSTKSGTPEIWLWSTQDGHEIRLTNLGIRQVREEMVEAGIAFGSTPRQVLMEIQIPLALKTIMAGLNQTLMLALSMTVIAALIGAGGLGLTVYTGLGRLDVGRAFLGGFAIVLIAIILDRVTQALGAPAGQPSWAILGTFRKLFGGGRASGEELAASPRDAARNKQ